MSEQIHIDSFMLADGAKTFDGKIYIFGGGWNFLNILDPQSARPITLAGRVIVPWERVEQEFKLDISLEYIEGSVVLERAPIVQIVLQSQARPDQPAALETATPFAFDIPGVVFLRPGEYAFVIAHDDNDLARTRLQVNFFAPESQTQASSEES